MRGPIVGTDLYAAVMEAAGWVCQCTGQCGNAHRRTRGTCQTPASTRTHLLAAPAAGPVPDREAVTATAAELRAWCPNCWHHLVTAATRARAAAAADTQESLFDL